MPKNCFSSNQAYFRSCKPYYTRLLHPHTAPPLVDMDINIDDALDSNPHHESVAYFIISLYDALPTPPSSTGFCQPLRKKRLPQVEAQALQQIENAERKFRPRNVWSESWLLRSDDKTHTESSTSRRAAILAAGALAAPARIIGRHKLKRWTRALQAQHDDALLMLREIRPPYPCARQPRIETSHALLLRASCSCALVTALRLARAHLRMFSLARRLQERWAASIVDRVWCGYSSKLRVRHCKKLLF